MNWIFYLFLSALMTAFHTLLNRLGINKTDPTFTVTFSHLISSLFLVFSTIAHTKTIKAPIKSFFVTKDFMFILVAGIVGGLSWLFYCYAIKKDTSNITFLVVDPLSDVIFLVLAVFVLGLPLQAKSIAGASMILIGSYLLSSLK